jgi:exoribonuclease-2
MYTTFNTEAQGKDAFTDIQTRIERVRISDNLRHDTPEMQLTAEDLSGERADYPRASELKILWQAVQQLSAIRDAVRGRLENNNRADFNFMVATANVIANEAKQSTALTGEEPITISQRMRGSPIDKIVSEWMIFANVHWASWLRDLRIPAMFRTQSAMGVRTSTHAAPHLAMGVPAYMWATSPLRRYADWLNQMQLFAAVRYGVTAPMKAPFQPKEVDLLTRVSQFDERYKAYAAQQDTMEKYWCLRWVAQHMSEGILEAEAIVIREHTIRLVQIPLYLTVPISEDTPRQTRVRVQLQGIDWVGLSIGIRIISVLNNINNANITVEEDESVD